MAALLLASFSLVFAQAAETELDSALLLLQSMQATPTIDTSKVDTPKVDVSKVDSAKVDSPKVALAPARPATPLKSVLYLGGGEHSAWYHLGVLYALESYSIPVDSVVGVSWGAFVGFLWAKGVPLDDVQRILLDPYIVHLVGHNEMDELNKEPKRTFEIPLSEDGLPSLRHRFSLSADTSGNLYRNVKELVPDTPHIQRVLARLRLQESLYRQPAGFTIPFAVERADGSLGKTVEDVYSVLPLRENKSNGELSPYLALPHKAQEGYLPLVSVSVPKTGVEETSPWQTVISRKALQELDSVPGVVIRAHTVQDSSRSAWIQAGFSAVERRLGEMMVLRPRMADYASNKRKSMPWFKFNPAYDSLSAELQSSVKTYWNVNDTGMVAPENFANGIMARPAYDSVSFTMTPTGDVRVNADAKPTFDVFAGGFGSNAIGPNVYAGVSASYVDQMEFDLTMPFFWGERIVRLYAALKDFPPVDLPLVARVRLRPHEDSPA